MRHRPAPAPLRRASRFQRVPHPHVVVRGCPRAGAGGAGRSHRPPTPRRVTAAAGGARTPGEVPDRRARAARASHRDPQLRRPARGRPRARLRVVPFPAPVRPDRVRPGRGGAGRGSRRLGTGGNRALRHHGGVRGPPRGQQSAADPGHPRATGPRRPRGLPRAAPRVRLDPTHRRRGHALEPHLPSRRPGPGGGLPVLLEPSGPDAYTGEHVRLLRQVAGEVSHILEKSRLYDELLETKVQLERANTTLARLRRRGPPHQGGQPPGLRPAPGRGVAARPARPGFPGGV